MQVEYMLKPHAGDGDTRSQGTRGLRQDGANQPTTLNQPSHEL